MTNLKIGVQNASDYNKYLDKKLWKSVYELILSSVKREVIVSNSISFDRCPAYTAWPVLTMVVPKGARWCLPVHLETWMWPFFRVRVKKTYFDNAVLIYWKLGLGADTKA